jgi:hypothetical protein
VLISTRRRIPVLRISCSSSSSLSRQSITTGTSRRACTAKAEVVEYWLVDLNGRRTLSTLSRRTGSTDRRPATGGDRSSRRDRFRLCDSTLDLSR